MMKRHNVIRFSSDDFHMLVNHLALAGDNESFIYGLFSKARGKKCDIYICKQLILPEEGELENQSPASIEPAGVYQSVSYGLAYDLGLCIIDTHTHPFSNHACFSGTDDYHGIKNAKYISEHFPDNVSMGMIVLGREFDNFEARIWNRGKNRFDPVDRIEIMGTPTQILVEGIKTTADTDDIYARHRIIPGWRQGLLEYLKVFVAGLGGNGALIFDSLLALGIGKSGWVKACDPDLIEPSNLPRIPYAYPEEVGLSKAEVAQTHANYRIPHLNVQCYEKGVEDDEMVSIIKEANIIIGAVDNDGARKALNGLAARYTIPYLDLATEIIPNESAYEAIGQVQIFVPGKTGCLLCSGAIDPVEAALDTMSEEDKAQYEHAGYIRGTDETPTPSVLHLNGVTSYLAISQLLRLIFNDGFDGMAYLHYNRQIANLFAASITRNDDCPVCGVQGFIGAGDENRDDLKQLSVFQDKEAFDSISASKVLE